MSKRVSVKTSSGKYLYKVSEYSGKYYCLKFVDSFWGSWCDIGSSRSLEDALCLIKSHASRYGRVYSVYID